MKLFGKVDSYSGKFTQEGEVHNGSAVAFEHDGDLNWGIVMQGDHNALTGRPMLDIIPILEDMHDDLMEVVN